MARVSAYPPALADAPKPPSNLAASYDPSGDGTPVVITFRNTTSSLLGSVRVYWKYGACPTMKANEELDGVHIIDPATPGEQVRIDTELSSLVPRSGERRVCVAAWSLDRNASAVSAGVTATFDVPPGS